MKSRESWCEWIKSELTLSAELKIQTANTTAEQIFSAAELMIECFRSRRKVLICGNGGSAADAQHMAAELVNRLSGEIDRPGLPAIALTTDTSFITAYANDVGYEGVFERQVLALGETGDVLIAISTSGKSANVARAVAAAQSKDLRTIGLFGEGGILASLVDQPVVVPGRNTQHLQECFLSIEHAICGIVEQSLFSL